jgi:hypothetical protein
MLFKNIILYGAVLLSFGNAECMKAVRTKTDSIKFIHCSHPNAHSISDRQSLDCESNY